MCQSLEQPEESEKERISDAKRRADEEARAATPAHVVRKEDRNDNGIAFAKGFPLSKNGLYVRGNWVPRQKGQKYRQMDWKRDHNRCMVCNMKEIIDQAADERFGANGHAQDEQQVLFKRLVEDEESEARKSGGYIKARTRAPYKARVALRLIVLFASVIG
jgi:hypothetical protein